MTLRTPRTWPCLFLPFVLLACGTERDTTDHLGSDASIEADGHSVGARDSRRLVKVREAGERPYTRSFAVIVGVNEVTSGAAAFPKLNSAVSDATAVRDILSKEFGYEEGHIRLLIDGADSSTDRPLMHNLELALSEWLSRFELTADDSLLFYFAGHGQTDRDYRGYMILSDSNPAKLQGSCFSFDRLVKLLNGPSCKACIHKLVILDCCQSGALFDASLPTAAAPDKEPPREDGRSTTAIRQSEMRGTGKPLTIEVKTAGDIEYLRTVPAFLGFSAARQSGAGDSPTSKEHSVFTGALLDGLRDRADSLRKEHTFTFLELAPRVQQDVASRIANTGQIPRAGRLDRGEGDFIFQPQVRRRTPTELSQIDRYARTLSKAADAYYHRNMVSASRILGEIADDRDLSRWRGFEYSWLRASCSAWSDMSVPVQAVRVSLSANGTRVACVSPDRKSISVWTTSGSRKQVDTFHSDRPIIDAKLLGDGTAMMVLTAGQACRQFSVPHAECLQEMTFPNETYQHVAASASGKLAVVYGKGGARSISFRGTTDNRSDALQRVSSEIVAAAVSTDDDLIALGLSNGCVEIYRNGSQDPLKEIYTLRQIVSLCFDGKGTSISVVASDRVDLYDWRSGKTLETHPYTRTSDDIVPNGRDRMATANGAVYAAVSSHGELVLNATHGSDALFPAVFPLDAVLDIDVDPIGRSIAIALVEEGVLCRRNPIDVSPRGGVLAYGEAGIRMGFRMMAKSPSVVVGDVVENKVCVWDLESRTMQQSVTLPSTHGVPFFVDVTRDGKLAAASGMPGVVVVDIEKAAILQELEGEVGEGFLPVQFCADGARLAAGTNDALVVWDTATWQKRAVVPAAEFVTAIASAEGRNVVAFGTLAGDVNLCDINGGEVARVCNEGMAITDLEFSRDGSLLAIGCAGLKDADFDKIRESGRGDFSRQVLSMAGMQLDGAVSLWDVARRCELWRVRKPHGKGCLGIGISADGERVVSVSAHGVSPEMKFWDARSGVEIYKPSVHQLVRDQYGMAGVPGFVFGMLARVEFSEDGRYLLCSGAVIAITDAVPGNVCAMPFVLSGSDMESER